MEKIRTLIVDDEPLAREGIRLFLARDPDIEIVGLCTHGQEAVAAIQAHAPDLLFLDVQMPEMNGFEVLAEVGSEQMPVVVFVTAYDRHAVQAFEVHALDYVLKPYDDDRFETALARAKAQVRQQQVQHLSHRLMALLEQTQGGKAPQPTSSETPYLTRLAVKTGGRVFFIKVEEIDWVEAADYYVRLHVGGKSHLLRETLSGLEAQLDPSQFQRIHRSTIVNLDRIATMEPYLHGDYIVTLQQGKTLRMSRRYRQVLEDFRVG